MKKVYLLFTIFCCMGLIARSQPAIHLGITTAMNSTYVLDKGLSQDPRYSSEATYEWAPVGVTFGVDISRKFGLQLETIKAAHGQIYQVKDAYDQIVGERNIDLNYFQFPLLMKMMSGGDATTRFNFQIGPQISLLQKGVETLEYVQSIQDIPEGAQIPEGATQNPDGTYNVPALPTTTILSSAAEAEVEKFKNKEVQIAGGFGVDIDMLRSFSLSLNVRANYSFTDMRNEDFISSIASGNINDVLSQRSNLLVGVQMGLHWMIGGTRAFKSKDKKLLEAISSDL